MRNGCIAFGSAAAFTIFSAPALLANCARVGPAALAHVAFIMLLWSTWRAAAGRSIVFILATLPSALVLTWCSCYGVVLALGILVAGVIMVIARPEESSSRLRVGAAVVGCALVTSASTLLPAFRFVARLAALKEHYWATSTLSWHPPFGSHWFDAAPLLQDDLSAQLLQAGLLLVVGFASIHPRAPSSLRLCTLTYLIVAACLCLAEYIVAAPIFVPHLCRCQFILSMIILFLMGWWTASFWTRAAFIVALGSVFAVPNIGWLVGPCYSGDSKVAEAADFLRQVGPRADRVIFGGSRTYVMFHPFLGDIVNKSSVFVRSGAFPDNFVGLSLVDDKDRSGDIEIGALKSLRIVYVQLEAAQSITIDTTFWNVEAVGVFSHPCNSIGDIHVISLSPK